MFDFDDWGSWGIGDFYNGNEDALKQAIESKESFDTGWHGFKKELESMRIQRNEEGSIKVSVSEYIDSAFEDCGLICDCLTDEEEKLLTDEMITEIRERLEMDMEFCEETQESETLNYDATYDDVMNKAKELMNACHNQLHECFLSCMGTTLYVVYGHPKDTKFIEERIEKANKIHI